MIKRPLSVTIVCWVLIVLGALGTATAVFTLKGHAAMAGSSLPVPVQYGIMFARFAVWLACGFCLLKGHNWARFLYVGWSMADFAVTLVCTSERQGLVPFVAVFLILASFLLAPKAHAYFTGEGEGA